MEDKAEKLGGIPNASTQCVNRICDKKNCSAILRDDALFCHVCGKEQNSKPGGPGRKKRGNCQGSVYKFRGGWAARVLKYSYVDDDGKSKSKFIYKTGLKSKTEAIKYIPILENQVRTKDVEKKKIPTLNDLWRVYEKGDFLNLSKDKIGAYKKAKIRLDDIFHVPLDLLSIEDLQDVVDNQKTTYYPAKDMKTVLSHLYEIAILEEHLRINKSRKIKLPKLIEKKPRKFTKEEQTAFWELYLNGDKFVRYILLMIYTGMMPGELLTILKIHIDLNAQTIDYGIKTEVRRESSIILPDIILPVIEDILSDKGHKLIHINKDNFYAQYYACLERAGCDRIPPYSCRHTTGSALGTSDIPVAMVRKLMRHKKLSSTMKYIHADTNELLDAANKARNSSG